MNISMKAPAKINLLLDVLKKREDGYHEVEMIMTMIDLADRLDISLRDDKLITVSCSAGFVPSDERNLAYLAAKLFKEEMEINQGVHISIDKYIPVAAGLAGGSSDAAAVLKGLNQLFQLHLPLEHLLPIANQIGSDVAFCLYGGTALATGRGEIITPISSPPPCWVVLAKPPIGVSTSEIYRQLQVESIEKHPNTKEMIEAIEKKDFHQICNHLGNVLEEVTLKLYPKVKRIKEQMIRFGATGVLMSGSGPSVYGLVQRRNQAQRIYNALRGFCQEVYVVRLLGDYKNDGKLLQKTV
ncbi:4-(cytidine 5'-diphospho)-2-C-methyl-D-erythritol kinase [Microaerobacter geothermalis]|uniref:4-(cytidine 5'-diphospho)-2-C-methyl-D-erythritol kinase n=1 Tax=Microaerobacter geothermalis TaxID=674972 RepID=UPI001F18A404|nr:4-(cytidine 5'-diphospho)-2-C-methyl-D-erythritol kinase [Microaerobacter geothermalis]MCF6094705.1 4-(cytidine 5'-diphospho)-2-C-methyl-D-erythritol kinase [Microaerobacter geothermalis]